MVKEIIVIGILISISAVMLGESLWDDTFPGYITGTKAIKIGDIIVVEIDAGFKLQFNSSSKDTKTITLEFSGGEYGDLFSFLPRAKAGGNRSIQGREEYNLTTELVSRVTRLDENGKAYIQGTRTVQFEGKGDSITIAGWVDPNDLSEQRKIPFSKVADVRLTFNSFLEPDAALLTDRDIERVLRETPAEGTAPPSTEGKLGLTEAKKRELVLLYINRIMDIIFH
jgi:flagellar basal body L-ring protein FlgH